MEQIKRIKVAMICYFSNLQVREKLPLDGRKLYNILRKIMHLPTKPLKYGDIAPWTTSAIANLSNRSDIELCVITPHSGLKKRHVFFEDNNVNYHFVACDFGNFLGKIIMPVRNVITPRRLIFGFLLFTVVKYILNMFFYYLFGFGVLTFMYLIFKDKITDFINNIFN